MLGELRVAGLSPFTVFAAPVLLQNRYSKACLSPWTGCDNKGSLRNEGLPSFLFFPPCCGHFRRLKGGRVLPFVSVRAILGRMVFLTVDVALGKREC